MHEWQYVHCFILDLCHYQDFFFQTNVMPIILHLTLFATLVPSCLSACPSKLCIRLGRGQPNPQADILHSCCKSYFNSSSTIEFWFQWAVLTRMVPPVWYLNGRSTFLCTMKFGRRATGGTSVIWATLILHYKETAEITQNKGGMEERLIFKQAHFI